MYRKYKPSALFDGHRLRAADSVLVTNEEGKVEDIVALNEAGEDLLELDGLLSPGFVNAHCHLELSHLNGLIEEKTGLVEFVGQVMLQRDICSAEEKQEKMRLALAEIYQSGTVAVGDICNGIDSLEVKKNSPLYWHNFIEVSGFVNATAVKKLETAEKLLSTFYKIFPHTTTLAPHAPYSVSRALFRLLNEQTAGQLTSIHNQEASAENEFYNKKTGDLLRLYRDLGIDISGFAPTGKSSFVSWIPLLNKGQQIISVHNSFTTVDDLLFLRRYQASGVASKLFFCICTNANLYIENQLPPIDMLLQQDCQIVLGTDSLASNHQLSIMHEIQTIKSYFPNLPLSLLLTWATSNGAQALQITDRFGSFDRGKTPGLVLIDEVSMTARRLPF